MSRKQNIRWLLSELPGLVSKGILPADSADRLRLHYGEAGAQASRRLAIVLFSVIGAVLVGGGIVLLLAHNWDQFSRAMRAMLAYLPMVLGQLAVAWTLSRKNAGVGVREATGAFLTLTVGACVAIVSQLYHISDDFGAFMLTWMLLIVPLMYVLDAVVPFLIYLAGITAWVGGRHAMNEHSAGLWLLAALVVPFARQVLSQNRRGPRASLLLWGVAIASCIVTGMTLEKVLPGLWIIVYAGLLSFFYFAGARWFDEEASVWENPLSVVGYVGTVLYSLLLSNSWPWHEIGWDYYRCGWNYHPWAGICDYALALGLTAGALLLALRAVRSGQSWRIQFAMMPVAAVLGYALVAFTDEPLAGSALFSLYLLVLSIATLVRGFRESKQGVVNGGLLMLTLLVVNRFFDTDFGLVTRGVVFILLGIGFFVANIVLVRRKGVAS